MSYVFNLTDEHGRTMTFKAPSAETITVQQWKELVVPPITISEDDWLAQAEANYELAHRFAGIPKDILRRMPLTEFRKLMEAFEQVALAGATARKEGVTIPDTITHRGVTYRVPKDAANQISYGQYIDLNASLKGLQYEDDGIAAVLAVVLMEGDTYDSSGLKQRADAFSSLPAMTAIPIAAFFFASCPDLEKVWSRYMSLTLTSRLHSVAQTLEGLSAAMDTSSRSEEPQS